jgi:hypothetical protein
MSTFLITLIIAFIFVALAIGCLAIGWLITGKSRIQSGACGRDPHSKRNEKDGCGTTIQCNLCDKKDETEKK